MHFPITADPIHVMSRIAVKKDSRLDLLYTNEHIQYSLKTTKENETIINKDK